MTPLGVTCEEHVRMERPATCRGSRSEDGGSLCVGVSKAALRSAGAAMGDQVRLSIVAAAS